MKVKKESLILIVVIVAVSVYLMMRKTDRTHYTLPTVAPVKISELTKVEVTKKDGTIVLNKSADDAWRISPEGYVADSSKVDAILNTLGDLTVTALISESESYQRYELDEEKKIGVKAWTGERLRREFEVGKPASSFQHTFVRLKGDKRVYHARGNFRTRLDQTTDALRDKTVLSFDKEKIHHMEIKAPDTTLRFVLSEATGDDAAVRGDDEQDKEPVVKAPLWKTPDGKEGNKEELEKILNALSALRCDQYINDKNKEDFKDPTHQFILKGDDEYHLFLYGKDDGGKTFPAISSGSDYPFFLPEWQVNTLTKNLDTLVED